MNAACEEGTQRAFWVWMKVDQKDIKLVLVGSDWDATLSRDEDQNATAFTITLLSALAQHAPDRIPKRALKCCDR